MHLHLVRIAARPERDAHIRCSVQHTETRRSQCAAIGFGVATMIESLIVRINTLLYGFGCKYLLFATIYACVTLLTTSRLDVGDVTMACVDASTYFYVPVCGSGKSIVALIFYLVIRRADHHRDSTALKWLFLRTEFLNGHMRTTWWQ